eukprot:2889894-Pyramimonas_sp.AAC.2
MAANMAAAIAKGWEQAPSPRPFPLGPLSSLEPLPEEEEREPADWTSFPPSDGEGPSGMGEYEAACYDEVDAERVHTGSAESKLSLSHRTEMTRRPYRKPSHLQIRKRRQ